MIVGFAASLCSLVGHLSQQGMTIWNADNPFDLGVWTQSPPRKKAKKSLSLKRKDHRDVDSRFESPNKSLETYQQRFCPENTKVSTRWAVKNFEEWVACHNRRHPENVSGRSVTHR